MNYRQWKKNYKKKHGYNPPLNEDKRKRGKIIKNVEKQITSEDIENMVKVLINGFEYIFRTIGKAFTSAADNLKTE